MIKRIQTDMRSNLKMAVKDHKKMLSFVKSATKKNSIKTVYIAGKVTGLPYDEVYEKFRTCQLKLEANGYLVINPCDMISKNENWDTAMLLCLHLIQFADYITLLPDWVESKGARMEKEVATLIGLQFLALDLVEGASK